MPHTDHDPARHAEHELGHDHGEVHPHGASLWARTRHAVSQLIGGHSHDAADQVDDVLEADTAGRRVLLISLGGLTLTASIQAVVVVQSGSVALLGDTLHNVADALTAVPLLIAFRLARRPATARIPTATAAPSRTARLVNPSVRACKPSATSAAEPIRRPTRMR